MSSAEVQNTRSVAYSKPEELTNFITYAVAAALSFVGLVFLLIKATGGALAVFSVCVFGVMTFAAFMLGGIGHIAPTDKPAALAVRRGERCIIALLMLGVLSPLFLVGLGQGERADAVFGYVLFALAVSAVASAVAVNILNVKECKLISLFLYVLIALLSVVRMTRIIALCGWDLFFFVFGGCLAYFVGTVVCAIRNLPARHTAWHLLVMCGTALHFAGIYIYIL